MKRRGFTLVELLVVMTILAILSSIVLFALVGVQESARDMKTRATIAKLNAIVMQKYESYKTRRVPVDTSTLASMQSAAQKRLLGLWELMRIEMPDRYSDINDPAATLAAAPSIQKKYQSRISAGKTDQFENAECLYLLVTLGSGDPDIIEQFAPNEIGDTDGDGMPEFHDGWDRPINFLRWAPGFESPLQQWHCQSYVATADKQYPTGGHDPFDPLKLYKPSQGDLLFNPAIPAAGQINPPLFPLIYSPGPDHTSEIQDGGGSPPYRASQSSPPNYPYAQVSGGLLGEWLDNPPNPKPSGYKASDESVDNITNHL